MGTEVLNTRFLKFGGLSSGYHMMVVDYIKETVKEDNRYVT
jgi:hypothetical protein